MCRCTPKMLSTAEANGRLAQLRERFRSCHTEESGFVFAFSTLMLTVLMTAAGFAIDIGNWYLHADRMQKAADAAALAGSVYLPNDFPSAKTTAEESLKDNSAFYMNPEITQSSLHPSELNVSLNEPVKTYFASLVGLNQVTIERKAVAEYRAFVPMGSPSNVLGVEPSASDKWEKLSSQGMQNHYWLNMAGGSTNKGNGDRYSAGGCTSGVDNCSTGPAIPNGNADFARDGQVYVVRVPAGVSGVLAIEAFDPIFAAVGDHCDSTNLDNATNVNATLYAKGDANPNCTGDQFIGNTSTPTNTTFALYTPALTTGGSTLINTASCSSKTYTGYNGAIASRVNPSSGSYNAAFTAAFRKWTSLCRLTINDSMPPGDYLLRVTTPVAGSGLNRFGLRAAIMNGSVIDTAQTAKISLFSQGRLVIYAHEQTGDVTFYLARIQSAAAGHTLTLTLFDIGDADGGANLSLLPPPDATSEGKALTNFKSCKYTPPGSKTYQAASSTCGINNITSTSYNGRIVNIQVNIPSDYSCNDLSVDGCWTRLKLHYGAGSVADTTSWEVGLDGAPVHLVANRDDS